MRQRVFLSHAHLQKQRLSTRITTRQQSLTFLIFQNNTHLKTHELKQDEEILVLFFCFFRTGITSAAS